MKLVLYSGGTKKENKQMHRELSRMSGRKIRRVTFIPADGDGCYSDFLEFKHSLSDLNIEEFYYFPIERKPRKAAIQHAFESDVIHLSGGNTFDFLDDIRNWNLASNIKSFVKGGGILTGLSAGAILMTPDIQCASIPSFDADDNEIGMTDLRSLDLLPFEISPHFELNKKYINELNRYSKKKKRPIFAIEDGGGIVVEKGNYKFIGNVYAFYQGNFTKVEDPGSILSKS